MKMNSSVLCWQIKVKSATHSNHSVTAWRIVLTKVVFVFVAGNNPTIVRRNRAEPISHRQQCTSLFDLETTLDADGLP